MIKSQQILFYSHIILKNNLNENKLQKNIYFIHTNLWNVVLRHFKLKNYSVNKMEKNTIGSRWKS